ncbi:MAG: type IV pilus assembly protein PilM [Desulfobacterales bacterium]|nr:type IV pilus assembly protein PilM [Desulfobacterales bacterium]
MFFRKKDHLIGLDIGSRTIKLAEVVRKKGRRILQKFGMANLPEGAIVEGRIKEPGVVAGTIRQLVRDLKVKEQNVATSVAGYSVIIKKIVTGKMSDEELQDSIQYEAEQYIPFDVKDVNIDFQILEEHEANPNQMNVMLVAAKKEVINEYVSLIETANLNLCVIDVDVFALETAFEENYFDKENNVALIDIGANKLNVNIIRNNVSAFTRDVDIGGEEITREIVSRFDCSFEEAEGIKFRPATGKMPKEELQEIFSSFISKWSGEIRRVIDFYYSTYPDVEIKRIIVSGGAIQSPGLVEYLGTETSIEVEMFDPFITLDINEKKHDMGYLRRIAPQAAICMGLASRRVNDK